MTYSVFRERLTHSNVGKRSTYWGTLLSTTVLLSSVLYSCIVRFCLNESHSVVTLR